MKKISIIVAGGQGKRMKTKTPKQFLTLNGKPILMHTLEKFSELDQIILVLPKSQINYWNNLCVKYKCAIPHMIIEGGRTRFHSVKNALKKISSNTIVVIHDGVRPLISKKIIFKLISKTRKEIGFVPVLPVKDSIRKTEGELTISIDRKNMFTVQTPQCFLGDEIKNAYDRNYSEEFTDDASVFEKNGGKIKTIIGERVNIKITIKEDLKIAKSLM